MLAPFGRAWELIKDVGAVVWPMRFAVGLVAAAFPFLWFLPQSQDALLKVVADAVVSHRNTGAALLFAAACFLWAFETFYWARFMSRLPAPPRPPRRYPPFLSEARLEAFNREFPRWLGLVALLVASGATIKANQGNSTSMRATAATTIILVVAYVAVSWKRRDLLNPLLRRGRLQLLQLDPHFSRDLLHPESSPRWVKWLAGLIGVVTLVLYAAAGDADESLRRAIAVALAAAWLVGGSCFLATSRGSLPPSTKITLAVNMVLFLGLFAASLYSAFVLRNWLGAPVIILSVLAAWAFIGSFFIALPGERYGLPVLTVVILAAMVFSLAFRDNHDIRLLRGEDLPKGRFTLDHAFALWYPQASRAWTSSGHDGPVPLVIVATAGGASRAGYWTTKVLGEIEDAHPDFRTYVFAVSGVSGGSLGAAVWRAMIEQEKISCGAHDSFAGCGREFFSQDFLSPVFLTGLYSDLAQRFLPGRLLPDRASALEESWEVAWADVMTKSNRNPFGAAFHELSPKPERWLPLLLINGTSEKTGRRIITSPLAIDQNSFPDALDFFAVEAAEVSLSTAVHNSARFPYVDAAGTIRSRGGDHDALDRIVDGGYFENFGAASAYDLVESLAGLARGAGDKPFLPVIVQISNDPALVPPAERDAEWRERLGFALDIASDGTAPPITFWETRDALGYGATSALKRRVELGWSAPEGATLYVHFRLTDPRLPMSWAMSSWAMDALDEQWTQPPNKHALQCLERILWPQPGASCDRAIAAGD